MNNIIILTGEIQSGKTTLLQQFCLQQNNIAGILTPIVNNRRMFYDISEKEFFEMEATTDEATLAIGKYLFSAAAFTKANALLLHASKSIEPKYLIIDEIGPLETRKQQGLYQSLKEIMTTDFNYTLILVARRSLVDEVVTIFNLLNPLVLSLEEMKKYVANK
jgi:nucleoside-triphosphatase THEP1